VTALEAQERTDGDIGPPQERLPVTGDPDRVARVWERVAFHRGEQAHVGRSLCRAATEVVEVPGAAIMLVNGAGTVHPVGVCGDVMEAVEDLQLVHGEGPCIEAHHLGTPVLEPDLAHPSTERWTGFSPLALEAGAKAVFGFPMRIGATCIGALNLCAEHPGALSPAQHQDALALADVATLTLLAAQSQSPSGELPWEMVDEGSHHLVVHQATGMVAVQLATDVGHAHARLRAHAFMEGRRLSDVARDVVARRLRLEP
jgi:hypothetical protein